MPWLIAAALLNLILDNQTATPKSCVNSCLRKDVRKKIFKNQNCITTFMLSVNKATVNCRCIEKSCMKIFTIK